MNLHSDKFKILTISLISLNVILSLLALFGIFEGKDLLPLIIGITSIIIYLVFLYGSRKKNFKLLWFFLLILSAIALYFSHFEIFLSQRENTSRENSIRVLENKSAPIITYEQYLNFDRSLEIEQLFKNNRYTIINFWATWCAPCLKEMPLLEDFYKENLGNGIGLIGFTDYKYGDTIELEKIKGIVQKLNITYPILIDNSTDVRTRYKADILPATVLIDKTGKVLDYQIGVNGAKKIMKYITEN